MQNSMTSLGKRIRMGRIFGKDGRALMLAVNHGLYMGPINGIQSVDALIKESLSAGIDSLTVNKGIAMQFGAQLAGQTALILKVTSRTKYFEPYEQPIATVDEAIRLGAEAIAIGLSLCDNREDDSVALTAEYVREADRFGIPTVAHSYPNGNRIDNAQRYCVDAVGYATRAAQELGIDIIKTFWTGSAKTFEKIVQIGSPAKVVLSGGPKCETLEACFDMTYQCIQAGASGITYGRNIWQSPYPAAVIRGLHAIVHANSTVREALELARDYAGVNLK